MSNSDEKHNDEPDKESRLMALNRMILNIAFVLPTKTIAANPLLSLLYWLFTPTMFLLYLFILTAQLLGVYHYWGDLDVTMEDLFLTLGFVMCYWEGIYFQFKKEEISKIFDILDSKPVPVVKYLELKEIHQRNINEVKSQCKLLSWFVFLSVNVGTLMWAIFPLVNLIIHKMSENGEEEDIEMRKANKPWPYLMFIIWVPYDVTTMPMYAVTYMIQVLVYFTAALYNTSSNIVFLNMILHATQKFKVVESSLLFLDELISNDTKQNAVPLQKLKEESLPINNGMMNSYNDEDNVDDFKIKYEDVSLDFAGKIPASPQVEEFLIDCIRQHQEAIRFAHEMNFVVSPWIAFALFIHQLLLVAEVFQLALTAGSGFSFMKHFMSIIGVLSQSLLLCWLGDRLLHKSLRVQEAAYTCKWYDQSTRFKKLLLMLMRRSQEPVKFSAGHFYDINIEKFDHILRRAYSYYAVLREMKES